MPKAAGSGFGYFSMAPSINAGCPFGSPATRKKKAPSRQPYVAASPTRTSACKESFNDFTKTIHTDDAPVNPGTTEYKQGSFQTGFRSPCKAVRRRPFSATSVCTRTKDKGNDCGRSTPTRFLNGSQIPTRDRFTYHGRPTYTGPAVKIGERVSTLQYYCDEYRLQEKSKLEGPVKRSKSVNSRPYKLGHNGLDCFHSVTGPIPAGGTAQHARPKTAHGRGFQAGAGHLLERMNAHIPGDSYSDPWKATLGYKKEDCTVSGGKSFVPTGGRTSQTGFNGPHGRHHG
eukprot:TRINITY_DN9544_c0_g1_i2.p1 TRINITY_DN9544_c0_g1~~TRINITY_DN9544_c0_g1_i2.p1  ORF type:complete len:286 (-),score=25.89 TRINITY_DN9544_c0_g1_i2:219-1076(-)